MKSKAFFSALLLGLLAGQIAVAESKPNIVYVIADEWRAAAMGYAGDPNVKTPNLDRLAQQAQNFRNAVSVCPVCTPHRAALMTGRYPTTTGMFLNDLYLPSSELCLAEILDAAGYTTGLIGKWHLDGHGRESYIPPERRQGFEYWKGAECDHTYNHSHYYTGNSDVKHYWEGYDAFAQTQDARQYLRDHARTNQPFMLVISFGPPHFPFNTAPAEFNALYSPEKIKLPPNVPPAMQAQARRDAQGYYAHCTAVDQCVGDLLKTLDETGLATNTIFVFSSDHGETLGSHGVRPANKQVAWSDSSQVPFLMRVPGIAGRAVETPLTTPDIPPTLLGLAGIKIPGTIEGEDLAPLIRAGRDEDRAALYMAVSPFLVNVPEKFKKEYRAIRTERYTYVRNLEGPWLLFDDQKDLYQTNNLVGQPEDAALVRELEARLQAELKRIGDDFRPASAYVAEWGYKLLPDGNISYKDPISEVQTPRRNPAAKSATSPAESILGEPASPQRPPELSAPLFSQTGGDPTFQELLNSGKLTKGHASMTGVTGSKIVVNLQSVEITPEARRPIAPDIMIHTLENSAVPRADFPKWSRWYQEDGHTEVFRLFAGEVNLHNERAKAARVEAFSKISWQHGPWHEWAGTYTIIKPHGAAIFQVKNNINDWAVQLDMSSSGDIIFSRRRGEKTVIATNMVGKPFYIRARDNGQDYEIYLNGNKAGNGSYARPAGKTTFRWGMYIGEHDVTHDAMIFVSGATVDAKDEKR